MKDEVKFNVLACKLLDHIQPEKYVILGMSETDTMETHFCAPLANYADLIVQRLVSACLDHDEQALDLIDLVKCIERCNTMTLSAQTARQ